MGYEQQTTWICDECGKRESVGDRGFPSTWFDITKGNHYSESDEYESWDICSSECLASFASKRAGQGNSE